MTETYNVILTGKAVDGFDLARVKTNVGKVFKLKDAQLDKLFSGKPVAVQRGLEKEKAIKLRAVLARAGALATVKVNTPSSGGTAVSKPVVQKPVVQKPDAAATDVPKATVSASGTTKPKPAAATLAPPVTAQDDLTCPRCGHEQPYATACGLCKMDLTLHIQRLKRRSQMLEVRRQREARAAGQP